MNVFVLVGVLIIIGIVFTVLKGKKGAGGKNDVSYEAATFMSPAERSFLGVLDQAVGQQYRIMGKVRLADILKVKTTADKGAWQRAFNQIQSKHIDFVACDPATLAIKYAIELDDATHDRSDRKERDGLVNSALQAAGIPTHHFSVKRTYSIQDIQKTLFAVKPADTVKSSK